MEEAEETQKFETTDKEKKKDKVANGRKTSRFKGKYCQHGEDFIPLP